MSVGDGASEPEAASTFSSCLVPRRMNNFLALEVTAARTWATAVSVSGAPALAVVAVARAERAPVEAYDAPVMEERSANESSVS